MGRLHLCVKNYAIVSNTHTQEDSESVLNDRFHIRRSHTCCQVLLIGLPALAVLLSFLIPHQTLAKPSVSTGFLFSVDHVVRDQIDAAAKELIQNPGPRLNRIHYRAFSSIPFSIDKSISEES